MAAKSQQVKKLEALRDDLAKQIEALKQKLEGVNMAIRELGGVEGYVRRPVAKLPILRTRRSHAKQLVLELLEEQNELGLNASLAVDLAKKRGENLERGTVSSLLSRLKNESIVTYDGTMYRLAKLWSDEKLN